MISKYKKIEKNIYNLKKLNISLVMPNNIDMKIRKKTKKINDISLNDVSLNDVSVSDVSLNDVSVSDVSLDDNVSSNFVSKFNNLNIDDDKEINIILFCKNITVIRRYEKNKVYINTLSIILDKQKDDTIGINSYNINNLLSSITENDIILKDSRNISGMRINFYYLKYKKDASNFALKWRVFFNSFNMYNYSSKNIIKNIMDHKCKNSTNNNYKYVYSNKHIDYKINISYNDEIKYRISYKIIYKNLKKNFFKLRRYIFLKKP